MDYAGIYAKRIREMCEKRGISINKLANMSGLRQSSVNNIMQGQSRNPKAKTLHKIANAFNMTLAEFLDFEELNKYSFEDEDEV